MIHLDKHQGIERVLRQVEMLQVDRAMLDVRQPVARQPLFPAPFAPVVERGVVDQEHVALGPDDIAQQFTVVAPAGQHIRHLHAGLDAGQA